MSAQLLYHMVPAAVWRECVADGKPYYPTTYDQDGFIHLTADPQLLLTVANHFYTASQGDWLVLVLDASKLTAEVKFEPAAPVGDKSSSGLLGKQQQQEAAATEQGEVQQQDEEQGGAGGEPLFPHLYGTVDFGAVVREVPMERGKGGSFLSIQGLRAT